MGPPNRLGGMAFRLVSAPKNYDWGVPGAISEFLGRQPTVAPEAELWWGNHPLAECSVVLPRGEVDFPGWLQQTGVTFPLLVKYLAAQKPLSIQVHPSQPQAEAGFQSEEESGIPLDAPERTYKDRSAKPELIIALSDEFVGLAGFVEESVALDRLSRWGAAGAPQSLIAELDVQVGNPRTVSRFICEGGERALHLADLLTLWLSGPHPENLDAPTRQEIELARRVSDAHPGDVGILFVLVMHHVYLARGEALFIPAGEVHAYIAGVGLEVMLPSDNVIRAGLTTKNKDTQAFLEIAQFEASAHPHRVAPDSGTHHDSYGDFGGGFSVQVLRGGTPSFTAKYPSVCLVEQGSASVSTEHGRDTVRAGDAIFVLPGDTWDSLVPESVLWLVHADQD
jgi:mannose-6-phosphate isomerase